MKNERSVNFESETPDSAKAKYLLRTMLEGRVDRFDVRLSGAIFMYETTSKPCAALVVGYIGFKVSRYG